MKINGTAIKGAILLSAEFSLERLKTELPRETLFLMSEGHVCEFVIQVTEPGAENVADGDLKDLLSEIFADLLALKIRKNCIFKMQVAVGSIHPSEFIINSSVIAMLAALHCNVTIYSER